MRIFIGIFASTSPQLPSIRALHVFSNVVSVQRLGVFSKRCVDKACAGVARSRALTGAYGALQAGSASLRSRLEGRFSLPETNQDDAL
jgi:hypothetical protein